MKYFSCLAIGVIFNTLLLLSCCVAEYIPPHAFDMATAMSLARAQGKLVLLVESQPGCGNCAIFMSGTLVHNSVQFPITDLLKEKYIYWFCDNTGSKSLCNMEVQNYDNDLRKTGYDLPLTAIIDPKEPKKYLSRATGSWGELGFYWSFLDPTLLKREGPLFNNIKDGDSISDPNFIVEGQSRWVNTIILATKVRINSGAWKDGTIIHWDPKKLPPNSPRNPTKWTYQLSRDQLRKGTNTIEVKAVGKIIIGEVFDGAINKVSFQYAGN